MYDKVLARKAQKKFCEGGFHFAPSSGICFRCKQNIYAETGHPVHHYLKGGYVQLDYSKILPGITVEQAGSERITGCPFCHWSFCE